MRFAAVLLLPLASLAAAPPASPDVLKLVDLLGSDNAGTRRAAEKKLTALGDAAVPALREAGRRHPDVDVRLRALLIAAAIESRHGLEERSFTGHADGVNILAVSPDG